MSNEDARSLPGAAQAALRKRAVQAVLDGMTQAEAARVFGVHPNAVNRWMKQYRQGGWDALSQRRRGRRAGEQAALSANQQQEVIALVRDSTPDQLGLAGFLWTREAVAELIAQRYGIRLARTTVGWYLRSWRFEPAEAAAARLGAEPGGGAPLARGAVSRHPRPGPPGGRGGAVAGRGGRAVGCGGGPLVGAGGHTPVIKRTGKRFGVNLLSAISGEGLLRFRLFSGSFAGPVLVDFLRRLVGDLADRKVHLILDGHPVHHAKLVSAWIGQRPTRIELHFLPGYSPEL
jgi:transposase